MKEPSYLPLFTGVEVCKLESSAKQYTTYYNFYFNENRINPDGLCPLNVPATCTAHIKKEVPEQGFQIDLVHLVTC